MVEKIRASRGRKVKKEDEEKGLSTWDDDGDENGMVTLIEIERSEMHLDRRLCKCSPRQRNG